MSYPPYIVQGYTRYGGRTEMELVGVVLGAMAVAAVLKIGYWAIEGMV